MVGIVAKASRPSWKIVTYQAEGPTRALFDDAFKNYRVQQDPKKVVNAHEREYATLKRGKTQNSDEEKLFDAIEAAILKDAEIVERNKKYKPGTAKELKMSKLVRYLEKIDNKVVFLPVTIDKYKNRITIELE